MKILMKGLVLLLSMTSIAMAGDYDWMRDMNLEAQVDPTGFRARLATRFQVGGVNIDAVLGNADSPADAYMMLRLGEMAHQPVGYVIEKYQAGKSKGWGALSKSLGIKPGSEAFHALKQGHDLKGGGRHDKGDFKGNGGGGAKGKGRGHGKGEK